MRHGLFTRNRKIHTFKLAMIFACLMEAQATVKLRIFILYEGKGTEPV